MTANNHKAVLVTRQTRLDNLIERFNTVDQARFYVEHLGVDFSDYVSEHERYYEVVRQAGQTLAAHARVQRLDRSLLPNFLFPPDAIVVVVGQDGLVANTLKYVGERPVVGVNPDPSRWDGVLLPFTVADLKALMRELLADKRSTTRVTMARARLSDGQQLLAVNDLFIGRSSHTSAHYEISLGEHSEPHSSSGVIVSTGLGSTGWLKSILSGARGIAGMELADTRRQLCEDGLPWDADQLFFSVREPFPSRATRSQLVFGPISRDRPLRLTSHMPEQGVIFSDGIEADRLAFNAGMAAVIDTADQAGNLVT